MNAGEILAQHDFIKIALSLKKSANEDMEGWTNKGTGNTLIGAGGISGLAGLSGGVKSIKPNIARVVGSVPFYHATRKENVPDIQSSGLDPNYGGSGQSSIDKKWKADAKNNTYIFTDPEIGSGREHAQGFVESYPDVFSDPKNKGLYGSSLMDRIKAQNNLKPTNYEILEGVIPHDKFKNFVPDSQFEKGIPAFKGPEKIEANFFSKGKYTLKDIFAHRQKSFPSYLKSKPSRLLGGLAGLAAIPAAPIIGGALINKGLEYRSKPESIKTAFSNNMVNGLENLGLGVLAAPSVAGLAGHPMNEKAKEIAEVGGLGVLAAHPTYELGHAAVNAVKGIPGESTGLLQRAGQGIGNVVNKFRGAAPVLSKLAYNSFYQELINS